MASQNLSTNIDNNVKLKILSLNVRGLRNIKKRRTLFNSFKSKDFDIICLQETYLTNKEINRIQNEWGSLVHLSESVGRSKGIVTLFNKRLRDYKISSSFSNSRCLISKITFENSEFMVVNVYAPCVQAEKQGFLEMVKNAIKTESKNDDYHVVLAGDFNMVQNNQLDIISGDPHDESIVSLFKNSINDLLLIDAWRMCNGNRKEFTWSKTNPFIARRLDYVFLSESIFPFCNNSSIENFGFSDHRGVIVNVDFACFKRGPSCYKFNNTLLQDLNFVSEIKNEINRIKTLDLDAHLCWEYIKVQVKCLGQSFGRALASKRRRDKEFLEHQIKDYESYIALHPDDSEALDKYLKVKSKFELILINESEGARIRSGQKWAQDGEKNTKLFLNLEKQRSNNSTIFQIQNEKEHDNILKDPHDILNYVKDHFEKLYSSEDADLNCDHDIDSVFLSLDNDSFLDEHDINILNKDLTQAEILSALKTSNTNSAPGPDGLTSEFYKVFWNDIKDPLFASYLHSFEINRLSFSQYQGLICLHHKGKGLKREVIGNWRPISLTNIDYKLIAKVLAQRLNTCLFKCVESDQYAFVKGRQVADLLRELDDIIENGKIRFPESIILSIDYAKAFDTLSLKAVRKAMLFFGFGEVYCRWIDILLAERTSCVRNGGYISDFFDMERGVRQGCPISPLLFILTLELLARDIRKNEKIKGLKLPGFERSIKIKMYADDATLFVQDMIDFREVLSRIKLFYNFSGLCLNKTKSVAMKIGNTTNKGMIKYGIKFVNKVKILGIHFSNEQSASSIMDNFEPKISQLERLCGLWEKRNLTQIGRITVLKAFGISLFIYIMQSISIKVEILDRINKILFKFIWNTNPTNNKKVIEKVKRDIVCSEYKEGGLNMIDIFKMQHSFLLKWADRLIDDEETTWKIFPLIYFKDVGGLTVFKSTVTGDNFKGFNLIKSPFWRNVLKVWLDYKNSSLDKNANIEINDPIFNNAAVVFKSKTIFIQSCIKSSMILIKDFMINGEIISFEIFKDRFGQTAETQLAYNIIYNSLKRIELSLRQSYQRNLIHDNSNLLLFKGLVVGQITRKNYYSLINKKDVLSMCKAWRDYYQIDKENSDVWTLSHKSSTEIKIRQLQWKILHKIYPTGTLLFKMKIKDGENCGFCDERDTLIHFFANCAVSKKLWSEAEKKISSYLGQIFKLSEKIIIFGLLCCESLSQKEVKYINEICLVGKLSISKFKFHKTGRIELTFENELRIRGL